MGFMPEQQDAILQAITAEYIEDVQAGRHPRLSDYLTRYPRYASAIADFVAYYHRYEEPVLSMTDDSGYGGTEPEPAPRRVLSSLLMTASGQRLSVAWVAAQLDLSHDIVVLLERRAVAPATIPQALFLKLAALLQSPVGLILGYFDGDQEQSLDATRSMRPLPKVAEAPGRYLPSGKDQRLDFGTVLQNSSFLSAHQKERWQTLLEAEQRA
jgi:hypothetical protein